MLHAGNKSLTLQSTQYLNYESGIIYIVGPPYSRRHLHGYLSGQGGTDREAHSEALKDLVNQVITAELSSEEEDADLVMFGSMIGTGLSGLVIDNMLNVEDYLVCSIGTATYDGEMHVVSVGLLNHVFTIDEEKAAQIAGELF